MSISSIGSMGMMGIFGGRDVPTTLTAEQRQSIKKKAKKRLAQHPECARLEAAGFKLRVREDGQIVMRKKPVKDASGAVTDKGHTIKLFKIDPADLVDIEQADVKKMFNQFEKRATKKMTKAMEKLGIPLEEPKPISEGVQDLAKYNTVLGRITDTNGAGKLDDSQQQIIAKDLDTRLADNVKYQEFIAEGYELAVREDGSVALERPEVLDDKGAVTQEKDVIELAAVNPEALHSTDEAALEQALTDVVTVASVKLEDPNIVIAPPIHTPTTTEPAPVTSEDPTTDEGSDPIVPVEAQTNRAPTAPVIANRYAAVAKAGVSTTSNDIAADLNRIRATQFMNFRA